MATARYYIGRAMRLLAIRAPGESLTADEAANGLEAFNDMLNAWALDGLDIGEAAYALDDAVYVPRGYQKGIAYSLAVEIAPEYEAEIPQLVTLQAQRQEALVRAWQADVDDLQIDPMLTQGGRRLGSSRY